MNRRGKKTFLILSLFFSLLLLSACSSYPVATKTGALDSSTDALITIDYEHHEIHGGSHYFIDDVVDLAINNVFDLTFTTANSSKWSHLTFTLSSESETEWYIYEAGTVLFPGGSYVCFNNDRNSANTCSSDIRMQNNINLADANADTSVVGATLLRYGIVGSGRNSMGSDERSHELILKQNTTYVFRGVANAAGFINFDINWYEHEDKN